MYFEPTYGLANRLRALASILELAQQLNKNLLIVWLNDDELNCSFHELFEPIPGVSFRGKPYLWQFTKNSNQGNFGRRLAVGIINKLMGFDFCVKELNDSFFKSENNFNIYSVAEKYRSVYVQTCADFLRDDQVLQQFQPTAALQARISQRSAGFGARTIGLHIRRTDHADAIANSLPGAFLCGELMLS